MLAIVGGNLIDGNGVGPVADSILLIDQDRIAGVGCSALVDIRVLQDRARIETVIKNGQVVKINRAKGNRP